MCSVEHKSSFGIGKLSMAILYERANADEIKEAKRNAKRLMKIIGENKMSKSIEVFDLKSS